MRVAVHTFGAGSDFSNVRERSNERHVGQAVGCAPDETFLVLPIAMLRPAKNKKLLPPFHKSRKASPKSTVTQSFGSFLWMTWRRHLQEMDEPNQVSLLF